MPPRRSAMDYESMATTMEADPLEVDQIKQTRRVVAAQALREHPNDQAAAIAQARETMLMLGIHPSQDGEHQSVLMPTVINTAAAAYARINPRSTV